MSSSDDDKKPDSISGIGARILRIGTNIVHSNQIVEAARQHYLSSITGKGGPDKEVRELLKKLGLSFNPKPLPSPLDSIPRRPGIPTTRAINLENHDIAVAHEIADLEKRFRNKTWVGGVLRRLFGRTLMGPISSARKDVLNAADLPKFTYPNGEPRIPDILYRTLSWLRGTVNYAVDLKRGVVRLRDYEGGVERQIYADAENVAKFNAPGAGARALGQAYRIGGGLLAGAGLAYDVYEGYKTGDYSRLANNLFQTGAFALGPWAGAAVFAWNNLISSVEGDDGKEAIRRAFAPNPWGFVRSEVPARVEYKPFSAEPNYEYPWDIYGTSGYYLKNFPAREYSVSPFIGIDVNDGHSASTIPPGFGTQLIEGTPLSGGAAGVLPEDPEYAAKWRFLRYWPEDHVTGASAGQNSDVPDTSRKSQNPDGAYRSVVPGGPWPAPQLPIGDPWGPDLFGDRAGASRARKAWSELPTALGGLTFDKVWPMHPSGLSPATLRYLTLDSRGAEDRFWALDASKAATGLPTWLDAYGRFTALGRSLSTPGSADPMTAAPGGRASELGDALMPIGESFLGTLPSMLGSYPGISLPDVDLPPVQVPPRAPEAQLYREREQERPGDRGDNAPIHVHHTHVHLDGKKIAEVVTKHQTQYAWAPRQAPYHDHYAYPTSPDIGFETG